MTVTWIPRLHLVQKGETIGWLHLPAVESAVLPRVDEIMAFEDQAVLAAVPSGTLASYSPTVTRVEHISLGGEITIYVIVQVHTLSSAEQAKAGADAAGFSWTPAGG